MSQIQTFGMGGIPPAGPVLRIGDDLGNTVGPTGGNIYIQGIPSTDAMNLDILYGFVVVTEQITQLNPVMPASTLKIEPLHDTITTNDAVVTVFPNTVVPITASEAWVLNATIIGARDDYTASAGGYFSGVARRPAVGAATLTGDNGLFNSDVPLVDFGITVVGNDMYVYAQGRAGETWNWTCTFTFLKQII